MSDCIESKTIGLAELYGANCFSNAVMRERLPKSIFSELLKVQAGKRELTLDIAEVVASAMRDWALERGATHYTHWFHPLSGISAEKHDSFISPTGDGRVLIEFFLHPLASWTPAGRTSLSTQVGQTTAAGVNAVKGTIFRNLY